MKKHKWAVTKTVSLESAPERGYPAARRCDVGWTCVRCGLRKARSLFRRVVYVDGRRSAGPCDGVEEP